MSITPTRPEGAGYHRAGTRRAVDGVSMEVPAGVVAGVVGPNGAGKTTTIRMLLALIRPSAGSAEVLGVSTRRPAAYLPRVGALTDGPAFYPGLSARRNLEILAALGGFSAGRVGPLLAQVGLQGREGDIVKTYSLGMRQRLGIAAALLPDPALLILDVRRHVRCAACRCDRAGNVRIGAPIRSGCVCRHRRRWGGARRWSRSERGTGRQDEGLGGG